MRQLKHGELAGVANVDRPAEIVRRIHHAHHAFDQVVDVLEAACLGAVAVDSDVVAGEGLDDEVGDHAAVVLVHARAVGVEDADDLDADAVLTVIIHAERFGGALALVVAGADADRVDVAPIRLRLRVDGRVAVDFARRGVQDLCVHALGQAEHVERAVDRRLERLDGVVLVVDGRGGAGQVVDLVDLRVVGRGDVVAYGIEAVAAQQVADVVLAAREVVVDADHVVAFHDEAFAEVRPDEACATGY